jgi:hypothetical protein
MNLKELEVEVAWAPARAAPAALAQARGRPRHTITWMPHGNGRASARGDASGQLTFARLLDAEPCLSIAHKTSHHGWLVDIPIGIHPTR